MASDLPCDADGACMMCKSVPPEAEVVLCRTCATPWHVQCLSKPPETHASVAEWECPDCSPTEDLPAAAVAPGGVSSVPSGASADLIASIRAIEADGSLTEQEKAKRRQELVSGGAAQDAEEDGDKKRKGKAESDDVLDLLDEKFNCSFCMQLPDRPVTTPCGHNFCLKCFQKWIGQGKHTCAKCRAPIPSKMSSQPRINSALVVAIRMAKTAKSATSGGPAHVYHFMRNENRPEKAFTTERAKRAGKANACCGQIFVTVPPDHFGPILADNDPKRNQGVLVGESWEDRMECRQWGVHLPHVAGIAGQSEYGAQSVALSGGYEDDEDHGEWFLYTGSGGRDLSGNKRTNKDQSFDQKFEKYNEALRVSCKKGYPVRVVRSHKEKRSSYAPESGVRYDGIYRIEQCWRKVGIQGYKVCRYLFVRCDNEPAPWTSDEHGDRPRPLPAIKELKNATDITVRKDSPAWDYEEEHGWKWIKAPPVSRKPVITGNPEGKKARKAIRQAQNLSVRQRLLKEFSCLICRKVMTSPLTTPCAHHFCKPCLVGAFAGQSFVRERTREGGRTLRAQKIVKKCPSCPTDISEFLQNPQVNREMMDLIETLQRKTEENTDEPDEEGGDAVEKSSEDGLDDVEENKLNEDGDGKFDAIKLCDETSDGAEGLKVNDEESDGAKEKEAEDVDEAPNGNAVSSRTARKRVKAGKKAKSAEVTEMDDEGSGAEDQKAMDVAEDSEAVGMDSDRNGSKQEGWDQAKGAKPPAHYKRKGPAKKGARVKKARTTDARDDGDDSPSSPLHVTADDDDFQ